MGVNTATVIRCRSTLLCEEQDPHWSVDTALGWCGYRQRKLVLYEIQHELMATAGDFNTSVDVFDIAFHFLCANMGLCAKTLR